MHLITSDLHFLIFDTGYGVVFRCSTKSYCGSLSESLGRSWLLGCWVSLLVFLARHMGSFSGSSALFLLS